jgi:imidazolonepropionase-like amidohydrolase
MFENALTLIPMNRFTLLVLSLTVVLGINGCKKPKRYDLIVENAVILTDSGLVEGKTILVKGDTIAGIIDAGEPVRTRKVVDADGGIVMPGFIDSHTSIACFFKSNGKAFDTHPKSLTTFYRSIVSKHFLPYGVTTVVDAEPDSAWISQIESWKPNPKLTDVIAAQLVEQGKSAINPKLSPYLFMKGVYGVYNEANISNNSFWILTGIQSGLSYPKNIEGVQSVINPLLLLTGSKGIVENRIANVYGIKQSIPDELLVIEGISYMAENSPSLLDSVAAILGSNNASLSTGIYRIKHFVDSGFATYGIEQTQAIKQRLKYGFTHLMEYVRTLHDNGVEFRIGCNIPFDGSAFAQEQNLLLEAGFTIPEIGKISSYNAAKALAIHSHKGKIAIGYTADLVVFQKNDTGKSFDFTRIRRIVKGGRAEKMK